MSFLKALIKLVPLLTSLVEELVKRRRHVKIDKAFEEEDPRKSAADINKFFD